MDSNTRLSAKILVEILEKIQFQRMTPDDIEVTMSIFEPILGFSDHGNQYICFLKILFILRNKHKMGQKCEVPGLV